jgi:hypothetical protein
VFAHLPELCRAAAEPVREPVRDALLAEVRDRDAALVDATGAARALAALATTAPEAERHRIRQAALDVLAGYVPDPQPTPEPSPESRAFVRALVVLLSKAGITPEERQQIREVVNNRKAGWFREELAPLSP